MADPKGFLKNTERELPARRPVPVRIMDWKEVYEPGDSAVLRRQAGRCMDCGIPFCHKGCPLGNLIPEWNDLMWRGQGRAAIERLHATNNFPEFTGRLCPAPCESSCVLGINQPAVTIKQIEVSTIDEAFANGWVEPVPPGRLTGKTVAVVGSGPAGLAAAQQLTRAGHTVAVFERDDRIGGLLRYGIPDFKMEKRHLESRLRQMQDEGTRFRAGVEIGKDITIEQLRKEGYEAFYVAIGCQGGRSAGIPGEDAKGVVSAVEFLNEINNGKKAVLGGKTVVIGGGNVAVGAARTAVRVGGETAMYCLESREIMPAAADEVQEAEHEGVAVNCGWGPREIIVKNGKTAGVVFKKCTRVYDDDKRFAPEYDENETITVECDSVIMSIGQSIVWGGLLEGSRVELGRGNGAKADELTYQTAQSDIFVGGDVYTGPRFAIDAIAAGKQGAISIHRFVQPHTSLTIGRNRREFIELDKENAVVGSYDTSERQVPGAKAGVDPCRTFRDVREPFTEQQVRTETARCLGCGASVVDPNKCIGCGVCTTKCEFEAIALFRERPECSKMRRSEDKLKGIFPYMLKRELKIKFAKKEK